MEKAKVIKMIRDIRALIINLPTDQFPDLLTAVIIMCLQEKVFPPGKLTEFVSITV